RVCRDQDAPTPKGCTGAGAAASARWSWMRTGTAVASSPPSELIEEEPHSVSAGVPDSGCSRRREASVPVRAEDGEKGAAGAAGAAACCGITVLRGGVWGERPTDAHGAQLTRREPSRKGCRC